MGDEIVGYITKGNGVTIHRKDCKMIDANGERIIDASWNNVGSDRFVCKLRLTIDSTNENLVDIITIATKCDTIISSIDNVGRSHNEDIYEIVCKIRDKETLSRFMIELESLKFVSKVER
jgi:GTP pyrophosphokinase